MNKGTKLRICEKKGEKKIAECLSVVNTIKNAHLLKLSMRKYGGNKRCLIKQNEKKKTLINISQPQYGKNIF